VAKRKTKNQPESDSEYLLKLVMYMIIGSIWVKITTTSDSQIPLPIGFLIGLIFASREHFRIDKKIEYAILLVAMLVGFWLPIGIYINL
jgi:hypothetical protein